MSQRSVFWVSGVRDIIDDAIADSPKLSLLWFNVFVFLFIFAVHSCFFLISIVSEDGNSAEYGIPWFVWILVSMIVTLFFIKRRDTLAKYNTRVEVRPFWNLNKK